ncbi:MAG: hypothetical protein QW839_05595 [Conexivisphaerales archaeon]
MAQDLNFSTIDSTFTTVNASRPALKGTDTAHTERLLQEEEEPAEAQQTEEVQETAPGQR